MPSLHTKCSFSLFQVNEAAGSYLWHKHTASNDVDVLCFCFDIIMTAIHRPNTHFVSHLSRSYVLCICVQVNEAAGSYLWHDHSASNKADGLQGALIVRANGPEPWTYDEERTLFLTDWFHGGCPGKVFMQQVQSTLQRCHLPTCDRECIISCVETFAEETDTTFAVFKTKVAQHLSCSPVARLQRSCTVLHDNVACTALRHSHPI